MVKTTIIRITLALGIAVILLGGCSYNELPPKTDDATTDYILPSGTIPTAEESAAVQALRDEYNNAVGN